MKTYIEPTLTKCGSAAELTRNTIDPGTDDPGDAWMFEFVSAGAVGFLL